MGIVPLLANAAEVIFKASPPVGMKQIVISHQAPIIAEPFLLPISCTSEDSSDCYGNIPGWLLAKDNTLSYTTFLYTDHKKQSVGLNLILPLTHQE